jgi:hypothetical protein
MSTNPGVNTASPKSTSEALAGISFVAREDISEITPSSTVSRG